MRPFRPAFGSTKKIDAGLSSIAVDLAGTRSGEYQVRVFNAGPAVAFVAPGDKDVTASTADLPIPSGAIEVLTVRNLPSDPETHFAAVTAGTAAAVYFTLGEGI